jgi:hypothetical protein
VKRKDFLEAEIERNERTKYDNPASVIDESAIFTLRRSNFSPAFDNPLYGIAEYKMLKPSRYAAKLHQTHGQASPVREQSAAAAAAAARRQRVTLETNAPITSASSAVRAPGRNTDSQRCRLI